ncbi:ATP-binding cassette, subfamily B [Pseudarcicella hirudinis]|uniref:ATP-binding cassette, subfamily B n=1 Tax=Pseudarcicella hirudinis TaxID=1079859 RepID=A0A1I5TIC8_9BACT|nr:peptidase domain-containing ABC transporter [Pseudarcicella hirudinis]SFP82417.1 ATP-binding cassette, subfamily B [Pseudarcicella hirudinis]
MKRKFKFYRQLDYMDCGPTCLRMISAYYGKNYSMDFLRSNAHITRQGVSMLGISEAAEKIGFKTLAVKLSYEQLIEEAPLPCILHWNQEHFVVLYDIRKSFWSFFSKKPKEQFVLADPGHALVNIDKETLLKCWEGSPGKRGVVLLLEPTQEFQKNAEEQKEEKMGFSFLVDYLKPFRKYLFQILFGMVFSSLLALVFPFLTQSLIDYGIHRQDYNFIHLILFSQLILFLGSMGIDLIRNWILLHINTRISVSIISNFLVKLMKLPISFFESKNIGDISQRINDHHRIEAFLTGSTLQTFFSIINLFTFSLVLGLYNLKLLLIFFIGSAISITWILIFLKQRKSLDYRRFQQMRENQNSIYELITGMQEIKLNNCERARRWEWERIQAKLFKINIKNLALEQYQEVGSTFVTQLKNILISYASAMAVMNHEITLGVMLSISYIVGQMNGPLSQIIKFLRSIQDAKISLDRLGEIHNRPNEETDDDNEKMSGMLSVQDVALDPKDKIWRLNSQQNKKEEGIVLRDLSFRYGGAKSQLILKNINLHIPKGKVTAIVGASGSGKTTLLKLLLKFYAPTDGEILVDGMSMGEISAKTWRKQCGTVMQDGYIFSDTIARNIAVDGTAINEYRMLEAIGVSNIAEYVRKLPLGFFTKIGNTGAGMSGGQKQRIFIARAIYKNPSYLFFDEATSALDANNERIIMKNLQEFFEGKTVIIIAHRLSTVKNADQIVVLENGEIKEIGTHHSLTKHKNGTYYELVKNQLELEAA